MKLNHFVAVAVAIVVVGFFAFGGRLTDLFRSSSQDAATFEAVAETPGDTESGFLVQDLVLGEGGEVVVGDILTVHYVGALSDGRIFDSSLSRGTPIQFVIGVGQVIAGWDRGVVGMRVGGIRRLVIPPSLAYGNQAVGPIPANSTLVFEVELLEISRGQ